MGICRRYVPEIHDAEDIVQESFLTAMQKNQQLRDEKALLAWLMKIVVNKAIQFKRNSNAKDKIITFSNEIRDNLAEMTTSHDVKNIFDYDFSREELLKSIDSLPQQQKCVFNLYYLEDFSHLEISNFLKIPVNTSKSHLSRARKAIQHYLTSHFPEKTSTRNRLAAFLLFFGLGNLLWAKTFRNKFSDFTIPTNKKFEIPDGFKINLSSFSKQSYFPRKIIVASFFIIILFSFVWFFKVQNYFRKTDHLMIPEKITTKNHDMDNRESNSDNIVKTDFENSSAKDSSASTNSIQKTENNSISNLENRNLSKQNTIKKSQKNNEVEEETEKVVVVKKIIERDTVFVESPF